MNSLSSLHFWVKEKKDATAKIDFLYQYEGKLIPIEVKSGVEGRLKSLHIFMDLAPHKMAIRFYAGVMNLTTAKTATGQDYHLLSMPYYLVSQVDDYLKWFQETIEAGDMSTLHSPTKSI